MQQLELIVTESVNETGEGPAIEMGIPARSAVERNDELFIVLSSKCFNAQQFHDEIKAAMNKLEELDRVGMRMFAHSKRG